MLNRLFFRILVCALPILLGAVTQAQRATDGTEVTQRAFVADTAAVEPGKPFHVGIHFKVAPKWHTYWRFGGSPSFPLTVEWELPE